MSKKIVMVGIAGTDKDFLLSIHSIKAYLTQFEDFNKKYEVVTLNYPLSVDEKDVVKDIKKEKPAYVCFSCYIWNIDKIKRIRKKIKDSTVIYGGPEISYNPDEPDDHAILIIGEGEESLYQWFMDSKPPHQEYYNYPSAYLTGCVSDDLLSDKGMRINIESQRGCNFKCSYCMYHKNFDKIKYRDPRVVVQEIEYCYKKGIKELKIVDANFFSNLDFVKTIMSDLIKRKIKMRIYFDMIPGFIDDELVDLCNDYISISDKSSMIAGIGLQTLNKESLKVIGRKYNKKVLLKTIKELNHAKIHIRLDLMIGLPRETVESFEESLDFVIEQMRTGKHFLGLYPLKVLPGSKFEEIAKKEKMAVTITHDVLWTPTLEEKEMTECLNKSNLVSLIFAPNQIDNGYILPKLFFELSKSLNHSNNIETINRIMKIIKED